MEYKDNFDLDTSQIGAAGGGRGPGLAIGGIGGVVIMLIAMFLGVDPGKILGQAPAPQSTDQAEQDRYDKCKKTDAMKQDPNCRYVVYTNAVQSYWSKTVTGYEKTQTRPFQGSVSTGCGTATSEVGPFYCPADKFVYIDVDFVTQLMRQLGAKGGDAAELYIVAHEYGHYVQDQLGIMAKMQQMRQETGPDSAQVRLEVQADCFAGAFFGGTLKDKDSPIASISQDDILRTVDAAVSVGDDRIQKSTRGRVDRDSWTHGSSEMRKKWLLTGMKSGPNACNTFDSSVDLGQ